MSRKISPKNDALGQDIIAFFRGEEAYEVVERDDGYIEPSHLAPAYYFREYNKWPKHQKAAIKYARGNILDVGAGAGRVSLYLQRMGYNVTAIDNSPLAIRVCKNRGIKHARVLAFEEIGKFTSGYFDTVVMLGNNFGLFGSPKKAKNLLRKLYRITRPSALIIGETIDPYKTKEPVHLSYHKFNQKRGRLAGQIRLRIRFRNYVGNWFDYLFVSRTEMNDILRDTGWKVKKFIGSGSPFYIAIIEKV